MYARRLIRAVGQATPAASQDTARRTPRGADPVQALQHLGASVCRAEAVGGLTLPEALRCLAQSAGVFHGPLGALAGRSGLYSCEQGGVSELPKLANQSA